MLITCAGIRSGWHDMANGANMMFSKTAFQKVKDFEGNYHFASGDDMFLIEKMRAVYPDQIAFVKSDRAAVVTQGKKTWRALIAQRLRWAGKNKGLKNNVIRKVWSFVGTYHFFLTITLMAALLSLLPWKPFLILLIVKWLADYFVLNSAATFFKRADLVRLFVTLQLFYFWYILRISFAMFTGQKGDWRRAEG
jgi:hypothetical protein